MEAWTNGRIERQPWQRIPVRLVSLGLSSQDTMTQVWFVAAGGQFYGGAAAVNEALRLVWWARPLTYLYRLPGIRQLEDKAYQWVADNRYRLPGGTASCSIDSTVENRQDGRDEDKPGPGTTKSTAVPGFGQRA